MNAEVLLAQNSKISELFCSKFPVGGAAAIATEKSAQKTKDVPINKSRLNQSKI
ncbi:hypothetical protein RP726_16390 [Candidatus Methylospira mobilis]|uniref:hypothetical protein n=1 Tax=Candidatus Methylospira mobilis TaxID=1808979 RepID=UPI00129342C9|nr:hypothetical protein [Candidatus Methylospira mobilis]WNV03992.1 hypothetical protein RP726_16390 [Candidatus Methylospira mobilis]